ncbi:MAG: Cytochrome c-552 [Phycisphaerae bacterium]|nr:Cytochrome c-552 [Phycisphaerae bacterium]
MKMNNSGNPYQPQRRTARMIWMVVVMLGVAAATFGVTALLTNIFEHKQEGKNPFYRVVDLTDDTVDPAVWGKNFPLQYDGYIRTVDMVRTRFGGSEALPHVPNEKDPRPQTSYSRIEEDPRLKTMWAGYAFSKDFREERGHAYMLEDQTYTQRVTDFKQPGTCLNCHASVYTAYKQLGEGDIVKGFEKLNHLTYEEARKLVDHPVSCLDCHDSQTMQLRVTRPAFIEGIRVAKAAEGIENYDVNKMATRQEMRSFVCGQCHVEYYFKGPDKQLTYPWHKGRKADEILSYYQETGFKDWTHELTGAPMLKAQHPEFELWSQGVHARAGVACADCHMPYQRVGALKISDHHVRSPLLNIANSCQTCHRTSEVELLARAETIQQRTQFSENLAMDALMDLIKDLQNAKNTGATDEQLTVARDFHRRASFLIDFVGAENSRGFHADQEAVRILTQALDYCRQGQNALRGLLPAQASGGQVEESTGLASGLAGQISQ